MFKEWLKAAGIRAARTFAQTFAAAVVIGRFIETDWLAALETALVAALASLLMSVGGLPELKTQTVDDLPEIEEPEETEDEWIDYEETDDEPEGEDAPEESDQ